MCSMITLAVGQLEVDWTRDWTMLRNHSALYQASDVHQIPCYYLDPDENINESDFDEMRPTIMRQKNGYSKRFKDVLDRIRLLGYSHAYCRREFSDLARIHGFDPSEYRFEHLERALQRIDVTQVPTDYGDDDESFGKFFRRHIAPRISPKRWTRNSSLSDFSLAMESFDPYNVLLLLADNPTANEVSVNWDFSRHRDVLELYRHNIVGGLEPTNRFLIVTEGSSDARIIKRAFDILRPHVADFFDYVDMEEGYPFSGTGSLVNFVRGLISISIRNNVIIIFDNDAEGVASYARCMKLNIPDNMKVIKLPDRSEFHSFKTVGPNGTQNADINGQAAAIECYLDLDQNASVQWTNLNQHTDSYQGKLVNKSKYMRDFLKQRTKKDGYDYSKISSVLDVICEQCYHIKDNCRSVEIFFPSAVYGTHFPRSS